MNSSLSNALLLPTVTVKVFYSGRVDLAPTVQIILVAVALLKTHETPSIITKAAPISKLVPERVISYPPNTSPVKGETVLMTGVESDLY